MYYNTADGVLKAFSTLQKECQSFNKGGITSLRLTT